MHLSSLIYVDAKEGELPPSLATHPQNQQQLQNQQQPQEQKLGRLHRRLDRSLGLKGTSRSRLPLPWSIRIIMR